MKKTILLPLFLGLVLAGCNRSETQKTTASNEPAANPALPNIPAEPTKKDLPQPAQVASSTNATTSATPASGSLADKPAIDPSTSVVATDTRPSSPSTTPPPITTPIEADAMSAASKATATASTEVASTDAKSDFNARIAEWNLKPDEIKAELATSGRVMRMRTAGANEPTGPMDDVLATQIKSKLGGDAETSNLKIDVKVEKGAVTLNGSAHSLEQVSKALALALDNPGVTQATSFIKLDVSP